MYDFLAFTGFSIMYYCLALSITYYYCFSFSIMYYSLDFSASDHDPGPPAAGKRSISKMVAAKLRCTHLTPENLVQEADLKLRDQVEAIIASKMWAVVGVIILLLFLVQFPPPPPPSKCTTVFLSIIIMEVCKAPTQRLKVQSKCNITHTNVHSDGKCYPQFNKS